MRPLRFLALSCAPIAGACGALEDEEESADARAWAAQRLFGLIDLFDQRLRDRMTQLKGQGHPDDSLAVG